MSVLEHLDQDEVWTTRDGRTLRLDEMEPSHRRNLQWWLRAHATQLWRQVNHRETWSMLTFHTIDDMPDGVFAAYSRADAQMWDPDPEQATAWLEDTPLMKRLAEFVADDLFAKTASHGA